MNNISISKLLVIDNYLVIGTCLYLRQTGAGRQVWLLVIQGSVSGNLIEFQTGMLINNLLLSRYYHHF
jgi:hypothetical protein